MQGHETPVTPSELDHIPPPNMAGSVGVTLPSQSEPEHANQGKHSGAKISISSTRAQLGRSVRCSLTDIIHTICENALLLVNK